MKYTLFALTLIAGNTFAGAASNPPPAAPSPIVTPDVATGFFIYEGEQFKTLPNGKTVVCSVGTNLDGKLNCNTPMENAVPPGKTFAGFRLSYGGSARRYLEVYFK